MEEFLESCRATSLLAELEDDEVIILYKGVVTCQPTVAGGASTLIEIGS